ncbi:MAG: alpha/beta hydrolase [Bacteroidota bacterium]
MRNAFQVLVLVAGILLLSFGCNRNTVVPDTYQRTTLEYKTLPGVDADLLSLDVYHFAENADGPRPIVVWVHGGAWAIGDKASQLTNKLSLFSELGYLTVSVNYRLSPEPMELDNPDRIKFPDHNEDVADAVQWIIQNIAEYGGDPDRLVLLGHSAGAHLVALTGTSPAFLPAREIPITALRGVACLDTQGYDVYSQRDNDFYENAFGADSATLQEASPMTHVQPGITYPKFFIAKRGNQERLALANAFIDRLESVGAVVSEVDGSEYSHAGINDAVGDPDDTVVTPALVAFLADSFE